jgi:hypothetical protein
MRIVIIATIVASLAVPAGMSPAFAQEDAAGSTKHHAAPKKKADEPPKQKANDKDYNAALNRLPTQKYDPWGQLRPADKH